MKSIFYALLIACITPVVGYADLAKDQQIEALDKEIQKYKDARDRASMTNQEDQSSADQHLGQSWMDYEEDIQGQETSEQRIQALDAKIKELEEKKAALEK